MHVGNHDSKTFIPKVEQSTSASAHHIATRLQHGQDWAGQALAGWNFSEKLNGCRAYWDGAHLFSKSGRAIHAPQITQSLPQGFPLDGELYAGTTPEDFEATRLLVQYGKPNTKVEFIAFDAPDVRAEWPARLAAAAQTGVKTVPTVHATTPDEIAAAIHAVITTGGEGLMARKPGASYRSGRNAELLKLKSNALEHIPQSRAGSFTTHSN
ncbi:hypothetical protein P3G55_20870 [Leptospira sp. 96542]|nr:hypothetical protein [Leptospira sp. 96542]